jgi:hypothetical protein
MIDLNKRIIDISVAEMLEILDLFIDKDKMDRQTKISVDTTNNNNHFVYGLSGLANLFGCSKTTANRIKQSGKIDKAITQIGNLIIIDADKAIELAGTINGKRSKKQ